MSMGVHTSLNIFPVTSFEENVDAFRCQLARNAIAKFVLGAPAKRIAVG